MTTNTKKASCLKTPRFLAGNILLLLSLASISPVWADKILDAENSNVTFQSIKKGEVIETHRFKNLSGKLSDDGDLEITIDLNSVDSKIPIRDERMRKSLFETDKFANATLSAKVDAGIPESGFKTVQTDATLNLHGLTNTIKVNALVVGADNRLFVNSTEPVIINAADFKLDVGIEALRALANLPSITTQVPVSFNLVFK